VVECDAANLKHAASNRQMVYGFFVQSRARPIIVIVDHVGSSGGVEEIDDSYTPTLATISYSNCVQSPIGFDLQLARLGTVGWEA
jgi:hypothetical protein